jgi:hypothetical protein
MAVDEIEQMGIAGIPSGLFEGPARERILQEELQDRVALGDRDKVPPDGGIHFRAQRVQVDMSAVDDRGRVALPFEPLPGKSQDQRQFGLAGFELLVMPTGARGNQRVCDCFGSDKTFPVERHLIHFATFMLILC